MLTFARCSLRTLVGTENAVVALEYAMLAAVVVVVITAAATGSGGSLGSKIAAIRHALQ